MQYTYAPVSATFAPELSALVHHSFGAVAASDWEPPAAQRFIAESAPEPLATAITSAAFSAAAFLVKQPVGFVLLPRPSLLGMLFVHPEHLRRGIAKELWELARAHVEAHHPETRTIELNATSVALAAYRKLGFFPISEEFIFEGSRATRMACWLPARRMAATSP
jgi:GNAT superfamily N-acetyltransferase